MAPPVSRLAGIEATTDTIIDEVDDTEDGEFQLVGLEPDRR